METINAIIATINGKLGCLSAKLFMGMIILLSIKFILTTSFLKICAYFHTHRKDL